MKHAPAKLLSRKARYFPSARRAPEAPPPWRLLAARLRHRQRCEIRGQFVRLERLDIELCERHERAAEIRQVAAAAIHDRGHGCDGAAVSTHDVDRLLHAAAACHDILRHDEPRAGIDLESTAQ